MSLTRFAHKLIKEKFDTVKYGVDATCGNGNDTLFLAGMCDIDGMIFSFDVQNEALDNAEKLLADNNLYTGVMLINSGHENMEKLIKSKVDVVMFNLGFLPNSESKICTLSKSTISALNSSNNLLRAGGMITVLCYPGTDEGKKETEDVRNWLDEKDNFEFRISEYLSEKPDDTTPVLYLLEKL